MTQPDLILKLIEQLIAEKEKNIKLQLQLEEYKKGKDQNVSYIVGGGKFYGLSHFFSIKKVVYYGYTTDKQYTQPDLRYIVLM